MSTSVGFSFAVVCVALVREVSAAALRPSAGTCEYKTARSAGLVASRSAVTVNPEEATALARPVIVVRGDRPTEELPDDRVGVGVAVVMAPRLRDKGGVGVVRPSRLLLWLAVLSAVACCGRAMQGFVRRRRVDFSQIPKTARIQVYYESLCPYSIAFITEQLWPTYVRVGYLMDVQLVPFGNAFKEQQQEKPPCAANIFNDTILSLAFVTCMSLAERPHEAGRECARGIARNWNAIQRCANGGKGRVLQDEMGERTWNLDPPHHYVPWIVINGVHNDEQQAMAQTDLLQVVCDATPDGRKPPPCFADMEERRALQKLSASVEERAEDSPLQRARLSVAGHSLKEIQD
ncbi:hypothetical protein MTO96_004834 [Rhipicephalus appendiculatus]